MNCDFSMQRVRKNYIRLGTKNDTLACVSEISVTNESPSSIRENPNTLPCSISTFNFEKNISCPILAS
jgi:hypothetical protein